MEQFLNIDTEDRHCPVSSKVRYDEREVAVYGFFAMFF